MTNVDVSLITTNGSPVGTTCGIEGGSSLGSPSSPRSKSLKGAARSVLVPCASSCLGTCALCPDLVRLWPSFFLFCHRPSWTVVLGRLYYAPRERGQRRGVPDAQVGVQSREFYVSKDMASIKIYLKPKLHCFSNTSFVSSQTVEELVEDLDTVRGLTPYKVLNY